MAFSSTIFFLKLKVITVKQNENYEVSFFAEHYKAFLKGQYLKKYEENHELMSDKKNPRFKKAVLEGDLANELYNKKMKNKMCQCVKKMPISVKAPKKEVMIKKHKEENINVDEEEDNVDEEGEEVEKDDKDNKEIEVKDENLEDKQLGIEYKEGINIEPIKEDKEEIIENKEKIEEKEDKEENNIVANHEGSEEKGKEELEVKSKSKKKTRKNQGLLNYNIIFN